MVYIGEVGSVCDVTLYLHPLASTLGMTRQPQPAQCCQREQLGGCENRLVQSLTKPRSPACTRGSTSGSNSVHTGPSGVTFRHRNDLKCFLECHKVRHHFKGTTCLSQGAVRQIIDAHTPVDAGGTLWLKHSCSVQQGFNSPACLTAWVLSCGASSMDLSYEHVEQTPV
jgi:hypothetical protein